MNKIMIADMTLRDDAIHIDSQMSFREKIEVAKNLDKLNVDIIETAPVTDAKTDTLLIRTFSSLLKNSILSVPTGLSEQSLDTAWSAVSNAKKPRLNVIVPVSPVQMEYMCRKKPPFVLELIKELVSKSASVCSDVEFTADDATRSEREFLFNAIRCAIEAGAKTVTVCDSASVMLPFEFSDFIKSLYENVPELKNITLAVECKNELDMALACSVAAIKAGARQLRTAVCSPLYPTLDAATKILNIKGDDFGVGTSINVTELKRTTAQMSWLGTSKKKTAVLSESETREVSNDTVYDKDTTSKALSKVLLELGYDLSAEDNAKVYDDFMRVATKKPVTQKDIEAIVATSALQAPPTYQLVSYVINSGNIITPTAQITLEKNGETIKGLSIGDGPIDAAFLAVENITGLHFELDDFQIQSVTEGKEAVGSALVKLRYEGKLYSGKGVSTDIIGASVRAYVSAVNKIVYDKKQ